MSIRIYTDPGLKLPLEMLSTYSNFKIMQVNSISDPENVP